ncbi:MAG TPA: hypothetical protein VM577_10175 [Anaerovoracaceae bacterium]|nr:hypothetical protein [Anaerovoracaceae bacterium]
MERHYSEIRDAYFEQISLNISRGYYRYIGKGSGRAVYDLGNGKVVKAARNRKGIAQNEAEYRIALVDDSGLFAKVSAVSGDYRFLVMDKADRIKDISFVWRYFLVRSNKGLYQIQKIRDIAEKYDLLIWDLGRAVNWGRINGKPIIIDYGFTREVRREFYKTEVIGKQRK